MKTIAVLNDSFFFYQFEFNCAMLKIQFADRPQLRKLTNTFNISQFHNALLHLRQKK